MSLLEVVLNFHYSIILFYSVEWNHNKSNNKFCSKQTTIIFVCKNFKNFCIIVTTYMLYLRTATNSVDLFIKKFSCLGRKIQIILWKHIFLNYQ